MLQAWLKRDIATTSPHTATFWLAQNVAATRSSPSPNNCAPLSHAPHFLPHPTNHIPYPSQTRSQRGLHPPNTHDPFPLHQNPLLNLSLSHLITPNVAPKRGHNTQPPPSPKTDPTLPTSPCHVGSWLGQVPNMPKRDPSRTWQGSATLPSSYVLSRLILPKFDPTKTQGKGNLTKSRFWHVKTWQKRDQPIPLPKLTQANLEQARSRLNLFKVSRQAHTPSFHIFSTFLGSKNVTQAPHHTKVTFGPRWRGRRGKNDYNDSRLLRYREWLDALNLDDFIWMPYTVQSIISVVLAKFRGQPHGDFYTAVVPLIFFRFIEVLNIDRVLRHFGGKQYPPNPPLNIDVFHRQSARNDDGWWPTRLDEWFAVWNNRHLDARRLVTIPATTFYPNRQFLEWYWDKPKRFLSMPMGFHDPRDVELPLEALDEHGSPPVVAWPDVPIDRRHLSTCPFDAPVPPHQPMFHFLEGASSYEIGSSSQVHDGTHDMCETAARTHSNWPTFSSLFEGLEQYIPTRPSPHTPTDLGLTLSPSAPLLPGRHSVSHIDTAGSAFWHYDAEAMQGRRLSFSEEVPPQQPQGRPRHARRPPLCGTGGRLGHDGHEH
ncbi:hypothetical protein PIB30_085892 [Stylosanthes scabra]|uniref:Aminotransferase-like plant mobile domain-containing protein n=1 Tax=Stylosanthes scabra TaxID=79078 RepID=A0ABU6RSV8_9FABA|nr:hypothetical protein [Stylosanthes scabra]